MDDLSVVRDWQQIKQQLALKYAGSKEGDLAQADSIKFGIVASKIEELLRRNHSLELEIRTLKGVKDDK